MRNLLLVLLAVALPPHTLPIAKAGQAQTLSAVVERAVRDGEPEWRLVKRQTVSSNRQESVSNPNLEEDAVTLTLERKGREVVVAAYKFKETERARHVFNVSTITPMMRGTYKLTKEGFELKRLVGCASEFFNCVGFFTNRSLNGYAESYDAVFMTGRVVITVRARKPDVAQRFALHIAKAIR